MRLLRGRKGDLTLNTIVVAALVIIVLVVMVIIFTGRITFFNKGLGDTEKSCAGRGGKLCNNCAGSEIRDENNQIIFQNGKYCCQIIYSGAC